MAQFTQQLQSALQAKNQEITSTKTPSFWEENKSWLLPVGIVLIGLMGLVVVISIVKKVAGRR